MGALDRLLNLKSADLVVKKMTDGTIYTYYNHAEILDGSMLVSECGYGKTIEIACLDYLNKISGKTLVFNSCTDNRVEVVVL